jgi:hypothetical protein
MKRWELVLAVVLLGLAEALGRARRRLIRFLIPRRP